MAKNMVIEYVEREGMIVPIAKYTDAEKSNDGIVDRILRSNKRGKVLRRWADHLLEDIDEQEEAEREAKKAAKAAAKKE